MRVIMKQLFPVLLLSCTALHAQNIGGILATTPLQQQSINPAPCVTTATQLPDGSWGMPCQVGGDPSLHLPTPEDPKNYYFDPEHNQWVRRDAEDISDGDTFVIHLSDDEKKQLNDAQAKINAAKLEQADLKVKIERAHLPKDWDLKHAGSCWDCVAWYTYESTEYSGFIVVIREVHLAEWATAKP